jgi:hypothetical protein
MTRLLGEGYRGSSQLERRLSAGSEIQSRMNKVRSRQPISAQSPDQGVLTVPALIEAVMRRVSSQFSSILQRFDDASDHEIEGAVASVTVGNIEPAVGQIAEARRKPEPQQVAEPEYVLGRAAGIGIVLSDDEGASWWRRPSRT